MRMSLVGCGLNIVLDPLFIFVFHMGIKGAALATVISNVLVAYLQLRHFLGGRSRITFRAKNMKLDFAVIREIASIGVAPFIMQMSNSIVVIFINKKSEYIRRRHSHSCLWNNKQLEYFVFYASCGDISGKSADTWIQLRCRDIQQS